MKKAFIGIYIMSFLHVFSMHTDIFDAVAKGNRDTVDLLLQQGFNVDEPFFIKRNSWFPSMYSDLIDGYTLLIKAVLWQKPNIVKLLLKYGATIEFKDDSGQSAYDYANGDPAMKLLLDNAITARELVKNNNIKELCKTLSYENVHDRYLLYYSMFFMQSQKQFEQFATECTKYGINLERLLYNSMPNKLLKVFLNKNIWYWQNIMFNKFPTLKQKKEMMIYQFNNDSISKIDYDLNFIYNNKN